MKTLRNWYLQIPIVLLFILGQTVYAGVSYFPSQGGFTGGTVASATTFTSLVTFTTGGNFPDGTESVPSIAWTSDVDGTGTGLYRRTANEVDVVTNGAARVKVDSNGLGLASAEQFSWTSGTITGTASDTFITREAAATVQLGTDVNGAAVTQTFKAADGITGTDIIGSGLTLAPGRGTGSGVSQPLVLQRAITNATGTTAQVLTPAYVACPTKILSNTSATAQTLATITTTSTTGGSVKMFFTVVANNGTLQDTDAGEIVIGWNNNAGTVAVAASAVYGQMDSDASGTLATTPTVTAATNVVSVKFTPTWVTIVPTTVTGFAQFEVNGVNAVACQ